jgi:hypothetical protein
MDFENLSDLEADEAAGRGYRFEVGRKDPEGHYGLASCIFQLMILIRISTKMCPISFPISLLTTKSD